MQAIEGKVSITAAAGYHKLLLFFCLTLACCITSLFSFYLALGAIDLDSLCLPSHNQLYKSSSKAHYPILVFVPLSDLLIVHWPLCIVYNYVDSNLLEESTFFF